MTLLSKSLIVSSPAISVSEFIILAENKLLKEVDFILNDNLLS